MAGQIRHNPLLNRGAGYFKLEPDEKNGAITEQDRKSLLHMLFALLYTFEGREFMRQHKLGPNGEFPEASIKALRDKFASYGVTAPDLQTALLGAHVAAERWTAANSANPRKDDEMAAAEKVYLQNMAFVTWSLWEDAKDHEFSLGW